MPAFITWDGGPTGMGTSWLDSVNWAGDVLPGASDFVYISAAGPGQSTEITLAGSTIIEHATIARNLRCTAGLLTTDPTYSSIFSRLILDGGNLNLSAGGAIIFSTIEGSGTLTVPAGATLKLDTVTMSAPLVNNGTVVATNADTFLGGFSAAAGSRLQLHDESSNTGRRFTVTVAGNFTNFGAIEFIGIAREAEVDLLVTNGTFTNAATGTIDVRYTGHTGTRTINLDATINNQGTIRIGQATDVGFATNLAWTSRGVSTNSGTISLNGGNLTLNQSTSGATFTNTGTIGLAAPRSWTFSSGEVTNVGGTLTGGTFRFTGNCRIHGTLLLTGDAMINGTLTLGLAGTSPGTQYDQLRVNGAVDLAGPLFLTLAYVPAFGDTLRIIDNDGSDAVVGRFGGLPEGSLVYAAGEEFRISYFGGTGNDVTLTRTTPGATPRVTQVFVGDGSSQRSRIVQLTVLFDQAVGFAGAPNAAFALTKILGGVPVGSVGLSVATATVGNHTEATLTFTSDTTFGSLNDGHYRLTVISSQVLSNGTPMAADSVTNFHRFYGDVNGDARVDIADFGFFSSSYQTQAGDARFLAYLDHNEDGRVDITDFGQFSVRYFTALP